MKLKKIITAALAAAIIITCLPRTAAKGAETEKIKTPAEAVREMTWGVNLSDLYMVDGGNLSYTAGYSKFAPIGIFIWFGDGGYDWLTYYQPQGTHFSVSADLPDYNDGITSEWVNALFYIGVMLYDPEITVEMSLSDSKLVLKDGSEVLLDFMDKKYFLDEFVDPNDNGFYNCQLNFDKSQLPSPGEYLHGAVFETTVELINVTLPEGKSKADYLFEYDRYKSDQYKLTDLFIDQGANVFRLPVTWTYCVNDDTFKIDEEWLAAVKTEVDYILDKGAYCILDMHNDYLGASFVGDRWEGPWMYDEYKEYVDKRFAAVWKQIAEYFRDCSQKLIFEPFNEPVMDWNWEESNAPEDFWDVQSERVNELTQLFVETVRSTGGNNTTRLLNLTPAGAYCDEMWLSEFELPEDDYLIVSVHSYIENQDIWTGDYTDHSDYKAETDNTFDLLSDYMERTGVPVIIGETGVSFTENDEVQAEKVSYFFRKAKEYGIPGLWWEDYFIGDNAFWMYGKDTGEWREPILRAVQDAAGNAVKIAATTHGTVTADKIAAAAGDTVTLTVTANDRCELDTLTVTDAEGNELDVADNMFIMPASAVTVTAVFNPTFLVGDVNNNGKVDDLDAIDLARYLAGWNIIIDEAAADVNGDGEVDDLDAIMLARRLAGWNI